MGYKNMYHSCAKLKNTCRPHIYLRLYFENNLPRVIFVKLEHVELGWVMRFSYLVFLDVLKWFCNSYMHNKKKKTTVIKRVGEVMENPNGRIGG